MKYHSSVFSHQTTNWPLLSFIHVYSKTHWGSKAGTCLISYISIKLFPGIHLEFKNSVAFSPSSTFGQCLPLISVDAAAETGSSHSLPINATKIIKLHLFIYAYIYRYNFKMYIIIIIFSNLKAPKKGVIIIPTLQIMYFRYFISVTYLLRNC